MRLVAEQHPVIADIHERGQQKNILGSDAGPGADRERNDVAGRQPRRGLSLDERDLGKRGAEIDATDPALVPGTIQQRHQFPTPLQRNDTPYTSLRLNFTTQDDGMPGPRPTDDWRLHDTDGLARRRIMGLMELGIELGRTSECAKAFEVPQPPGLPA